MQMEMVEIKTSHEAMHGLFYAAEGQVRGTVMLLHGNCHNFYTGPSRFLPPMLVERGYHCLAFNRRGHDMVTSTYGRDIGGGAFQTSAQAIEDNCLAANWLRGRGLDAPILVGHSNGGMLAAQHAADHPETPLLVMLSAHCGGKDIAKLNSANGLWARDRLDELTQQAQQMVSEGRGKSLMLLPGWWWVISAEAFLDYVSGVPDTVENAERICCPTLVLRGDQENPLIYPTDTFKARCKTLCDAMVIENCDHFYSGKEQIVASIVADWIDAHS
jgi:pimeloyl-ACP methyl ester carboxylesterase